MIRPDRRPGSRVALRLSFLVSALLVTRVAFRSHYLYDIDSVNFALGLRRFDPVSYQPHPPGYFLYICLGRLANMLFHDANTALVAISIAASCGALLTIYILAHDWFGESAALFASLLFLFSPLAWFHGTVALTYAVEALCSALTGYLCWRVFCGSASLVMPLMLIVGISTGFRPSFLLFMSPLLLFSLRKVSRRVVIAGLGILALTLLAWGLPMLSQSGGLLAWWTALLSLWRMVPAKQTLFNSSLANSVARVCTTAGIYVLCFGCAALLTFRSGQPGPASDRSKKIFTWVWVAPGLLFFSLIFLKFVNSGYLLVISPPVFVWLGFRASHWYTNLRLRNPAKIAVLTTLAAANSLIFLYAPVYCSWSAMRRFETQLSAVLLAIPRIAKPADTLIVGFDSHFMGYRHAGYYLPAWAVAQYPEVRLVQGIRVFTMQQGDTRLAIQLPVTRFRNFLLFPLPSDDAEYRDYLGTLRARFPRGTLRVVTAAGLEFYVGKAGDLPLLFPVTAGRTGKE